MTSTDFLTFSEESVGHPIGWDDMNNWSESQIRRLHGNAKKYVENGGTLTEYEVGIYVRLLRRAKSIDMNVEDCADSIIEVLLK